MKKLRFEGYSDDVFGEEETGITIDSYRSDSPLCFLLESKEENSKLVISGSYSPYLTTGHGCWNLSVCQAEEDYPIPDWNIRIKQSAETKYTPAILLDVPDDTTIKKLDEEDK